MILSFQEQFVPKVLAGTKTTTIRNTQRFKSGTKIHYWRGNPRNVTQSPYHFANGICTVSEPVIIDPIKKVVELGINRITKAQFLDVFARRDGFLSFEDMITNWPVFTQKYSGYRFSWSHKDLVPVLENYELELLLQELATNN